MTAKGQAIDEATWLLRTCELTLERAQSDEVVHAMLEDTTGIWRSYVAQARRVAEVLLAQEDLDPHYRENLERGLARIPALYNQALVEEP